MPNFDGPSCTREDQVSDSDTILGTHKVSVTPGAREIVAGLVTVEHGAKCPVSNSVPMFTSSAAQGTMLSADAVESSGWS